MIRKQRILHSLRKVVTQQRHDFKVDNLKDQLSANCNLWSQLAESQAREKALKQESQASQQEMALKDRQIERLKDLLQAERREVKKLLDYKATKQKRLEQLETHAREFEVLSSVNLKKLIGMLEAQDHKIADLSKQESGQRQVVDELRKMADAALKREQKKTMLETQLKLDALKQLSTFKSEMQGLQAKGSRSLDAEFWKHQTQRLLELSQHLVDDFDGGVSTFGLGPLPEQDSVFDANAFEAPSRAQLHSISVKNPATLQSDAAAGAKTHHALSRAIKGIGARVREKLLDDHYHSVDKLQMTTRGDGDPSEVSRNHFGVGIQASLGLAATSSVLAGDTFKSVAGRSPGKTTSTFLSGVNTHGQTHWQLPRLLSPSKRQPAGGHQPLKLTANTQYLAAKNARSMLQNYKGGEIPKQGGSQTKENGNRIGIKSMQQNVFASLQKTSLMRLTKRGESSLELTLAGHQKRAPFSGSSEKKGFGGATESYFLGAQHEAPLQSASVPDKNLHVRMSSDNDGASMTSSAVNTSTQGPLRSSLHAQARAVDVPQPGSSQEAYQGRDSIPTKKKVRKQFPQLTKIIDKQKSNY